MRPFLFSTPLQHIKIELQLSSNRFDISLKGCQMIDLVQLRNNPDQVRALILKKDPAFDIQRLISLDEQLRTHRQVVEDLRNQKNMLADQAKSGITPEIREQSIAIGKQLKAKEADLSALADEFTQLYLACPNIPMVDIPAGDKSQNTVVKMVGEQKEFAFEPKNHVELGENLDWFDFSAAAKMTGSNFALYKGEAVKLMYALTMLMLKNNIKYGFTPILPSYLINEQSLVAASNFPKFKDQVYKLPEDDLYLSPTAEVNLTNMYRDYIFKPEELPVRMTAWTSCFRREAGGYGATERGLIRIHQFEKVELYTICKPEGAQAEQEKMLACAQDILQQLGLHYRISLLAAQDCSFPSAKTFDIEVWLPGQKEYYEVSSVSNCTDFQSRRAAMRYREGSADKPRLVYTLNGSSLALPRLVVALMETYQQADGSIAIPEVLKPFMI